MIRTSTCLGLLLLLLARPGKAQQTAHSLEFIENRGQWDAHARYAAQVAPGARLFVENTGLTYALTAGLPDHSPHADASSASLKGHALRVEFVQPGPEARLTAPDAPLPGAHHYLRGSDPAHWAQGVQAWPELRYRELWPGIDMVLKENTSGQLEYDLLLAAGADPARARLRYQGASSLTLDPATGRLQAATTAGPLTEYRPQAWQTDLATGQHRPVACAFVLKGTTVEFKLGKYDHKLPLVIDPAVQFASYTGSAVENWGFAATHDAAGNLYTAGVVFATGYPVTTGAYQTTFNGNIDVAIMKFNTGTTGPGARAWATYLGGSQLEFPHSLLVNGRNELLLLGSTSSADYPTTAGALSRTFKGGPSVSPFGGNSPFIMTTGADLVLTRLSASGGGLRASTYLGGTSTDGLLDANAPTPRLRHNYGDAFRGDLALDPQGNVYVASVTSSANFPGLTTAYQGGPSDGLVASLDSSFSQVRWATLLGGSGADAAYSLQREDTGGLLVAGGTTSPNLAGVANGYLATPGGDVDGFVARLSAGGVLAQATYLGAGSYDQAFFVRSSPGGLLVLGQTLSQAWPGADTARYHTAHGQHFIQQLAPDLLSAGYATVFGSGRATTDISPTAFGVDCYGRIALAGWGGGLDPNGGNTIGLATTPNALQRTTDGQDFYLMQLSDGARGLDYATYFGTSADDHVDGGGSRFDANLTLFQAMCACDQPGGQSIPLPLGATTYVPTNGAAHCNNAAFKFAMTAGSSPAGSDTLSLCAQAPRVRLSGSPAGGVWSGPGVTGNATQGYYFTPSQNMLGVQVLTYTSPPAASGCAGVSTRRITVLSQPVANIASPQTVFCLDAGVPLPPVTLTGTPAGGTFHGTGVVVNASGAAVFDPVLAGVGGHFVSYEVALGRCPVSAVLTMDVQKVKHMDAGGPIQLCLNDPPMQLGGSPTGGIWTGPGVTGNVALGFFFTPLTVGVGGPYQLIYSMSVAPPACPIVSDTLLVVVIPSGGTVTVPRDSTFCLRNQVVRLYGGLPAGGSWSGPGVTGSVAAGFVFTAAPNLVGAQTLTYTGPPGPTPACPGRAQRKLTVTTSGLATVSAGALAVCAVGGPQALQATPGGGTWSGPGVTGSVAQGFVFTPSPALVGIQTLGYIGAPPANPAQCPIAGSLEIQVLAVPTVALDPIGPIAFCLTAPPHGTVLTASPPGGVFSGPGVVANRFNPATVGPGHYILSYTWNYPNVNCPIVATQAVDVVLVPPPHLPADTLLCEGSRTPFQLQATPSGGIWSGPGVTATGLFTPPATPGTTVLSYDLPSGCGSATYRITVPAQPTSAVVRWTVPACPANGSAPRHLRFEATGVSAAQVKWDFGDGSAPATGAVVEHTYTTAGHYQPLASLSGPVSVCDNQLSHLPPVEVEIPHVPNIITPNGDGLNDTFAPKLGGCPGRLRVFSRWGLKVFEVPEYHNDWGAAGLPEGLYYYVLDGADAAAQVKGWVEVVR